MRKSFRIWVAAAAAGLLLQGCFILAGYALIRTASDIISILNRVNDTMERIRVILDEGKEIKRAQEEGRLIATLCERIPSLIRDQVEKPVRREIEKFSGDLRAAAFDLAGESLAEDLIGANKAYDNMVNVYNEFAAYMNDLTAVK